MGGTAGYNDFRTSGSLPGPGSDDALVKRCLKRDDRAWETMVKIHSKRIFNMCYRFTGRRDEAEDLTQEVFLRVYQNLKNYRSESGCFQSWLLRLGRNLIIDHYRQTRRFQKSVIDQPVECMPIEDDRNPNPYRAVQQDEDSRSVTSGLAALSPEIKEAIIMRDIEGLSYNEIAEILRNPVGTIKSRVSRGRLMLAVAISRWRTAELARKSTLHSLARHRNAQAIVFRQAGYTVAA
jgi:RNA polymerase sigma-70 factor, ECF subfamily